MYNAASHHLQKDHDRDNLWPVFKLFKIISLEESFEDLSDIPPEHLPLMIGVSRHREQTSEFLDVAFQFRDPESDSFVLEQEGAIIG